MAKIKIPKDYRTSIPDQHIFIDDAFSSMPRLPKLELPRLEFPRYNLDLFTTTSKPKQKGRFPDMEDYRRMTDVVMKKMMETAKADCGINSECLDLTAASKIIDCVVLKKTVVAIPSDSWSIYEKYGFQVQQLFTQMWIWYSLYIYSKC